MKWLPVILILCSCTSTKTIGRLQGRVVSGDVVRLQWRSLNDVNISNPNSGYTTVTLKKMGTYRFELTGVDKNGLTGKDTVEIKIIR